MVGWRPELVVQPEVAALVEEVEFVRREPFAGRGDLGLALVFFAAIGDDCRSGGGRPLTIIRDSRKAGKGVAVESRNRLAVLHLFPRDGERVLGGRG